MFGNNNQLEFSCNIEILRTVYNTMGLLVFYFALAVLVSFLCSVLEAVLLSLTPSYLSAMRSSGSRAGRILDELKRDVDRPLAAILSLNTIAHTVGAAGVGAQAQVVFANLPLSVISAVLTLLILIFSEIIPKTIGAEYWRVLAVPSGYLIHFLTILLWPLVVMSRGFSRLLTRGERSPMISREEITAVADLGREEGVLDVLDSKMVQNIIHFQSMKVEDVITPRPVVISLNALQNLREVFDSGQLAHYSRYPVIESGEKIRGYVLKNDLLLAAARDEWDRDIIDFVKEVLIFPEQMPLKLAFSTLVKSRNPMAVVVDEFGSFSGVLTMEDLVETLLGQEIMDEGDQVENLREWAKRNAHNSIKQDSQ